MNDRWIRSFTDFGNRPILIRRSGLRMTHMHVMEQKWTTQESRESNRNVILSLKNEAWKPIYFIRRDNIYYRILSATWHVMRIDIIYDIIIFIVIEILRSSYTKKKTISNNCIPFTYMAVSIFYTIFLRSMRKSRSIHPVIDYYNEYRYCNDYTIYSSRTKPHDFANHRPRISTYIYYIRI